jgi:hypothetical protein
MIRNPGAHLNQTLDQPGLGGGLITAYINTQNKKIGS